MAAAGFKRMHLLGKGAKQPAPPAPSARCSKRKLPFACRLVSARWPLVRPLLLVLALASAAAAETPQSEAPAEATATLASEGLLAVWFVVFVALGALYSYERARGPGRSIASHPHPPLPPPPLPPPPLPASPVPQRPAAIGALFAPVGKAGCEPVRPEAVRAAAKRAPVSSPRTPVQKPQAAPRAEAPAKAEKAQPQPKPEPQPECKQTEARVKTPPARKRAGLGAVQSGEEAFSVADAEGERVAEAEASAPEPAAPPAFTAPAVAAAPPAEGAVPMAAATDAVHGADCVRLCAALRSRGRYAEAARLARYGLRGAGDPGPLLVELSRAERGLGRVDAAIDAARDAHFASRSRETVTHLVQLLTETRRFVREDGPSLRRAAGRHPREPLLLRAAGVFESMYGSASDAEKWLRAALPLAPDEETRRAIAGELAQVMELRQREGGGPTSAA